MQRFIKVLSTPAARSSAIYYFGNFALSVGRYLFHLVLLRLLLPAEYGEFLAYLSLMYLLGIPSGVINTIVTRYVSEFSGKNQKRTINHFFYYFLGKITPHSLLMGTLLMIASRPLSIIFKAHPAAFVILGISLFLNFAGTLVRGYLNAFQRFAASIGVGVVEIILTIVLAALFISANLSATGVVLAQLIANVVGILIILFLIRKAIYPRVGGRRETFRLSGFTGYSLIFAVGTTSLISSDVLLVRYFFDEHLSGIYSSLSVLGRMVYFGLGPLISLVLPIAAHRQATAKTSRSVLVKLGSVVLLFGLIGTAFFVFFPGLIVSLFSGANYTEAASLLPLFAISMLLFSLNLFAISYLMAVGKPQANRYFLAATLAQPLLIVFFHQNISQVVWINLVVESLLFIPLLREVKASIYNRS